LSRAPVPYFRFFHTFRIDPHFESLREEPEFKRLIADLERKYTAITIQRL